VARAYLQRISICRPIAADTKRSRQQERLRLYRR